jgi:hypothetical protein
MADAPVATTEEQAEGPTGRVGAIIFSAVIGTGMGGIFGALAAGLISVISAAMADIQSMMQVAGITVFAAVLGCVAGILTGLLLGTGLGFINESESKVPLPIASAVLAGILGILWGIGGGLTCGLVAEVASGKYGFLGAVVGVVAGIIGGYCLGMFTKMQLDLRQERWERFRTAS